MPPFEMRLPKDVEHKLAQYQAIYGREPTEVVLALALEVMGRAYGQSAEDVVADLLRHSAIRQFPICWFETANLQALEAALQGDANHPKIEATEA